MIIDGVHEKEEIDEITMKAETLRENEASKRSECPRYIVLYVEPKTCFSLLER